MIFQRISHLATILYILLSSLILHSHGFHKDTLILYDRGRCISPLHQIVERVKNNTTQYVSSYDQEKQKYVEKRARVAGYSRVPFYCIISINDGECPPIICSPTQHFYRLSDNAWVPAHDLRTGDRLLAQRNGFVYVANLEFIQESLRIYTIHVKDTYAFLVGTHGIVAHNVILPVAATIGLGIPFSTGCGGGVGAVFGPIGFVGGILLGAGCGFLVNACFKERYVEYGIALQGNEASSFNSKSGSACSSAGGGSNFDPNDPKNREKKEKVHTTNKQDKIDAEKLGYTLDRDPPFKSHDKLAFRKGQRWISADRDCHNGGRWKMYDRLGNRLGTFNADLVRIKT